MDPLQSGCCRVSPHGARQGVFRDTQNTHLLLTSPSTLLGRQLPPATCMPQAACPAHTHQLGWRLGFLPGSPPSVSLLCLRTGGNRPQRNTALHGLDGRETSRHRCGPWLWTAGSPVTPTPHFTERAGTPTWKSIQCAQCQQPPHQGTAEQSQQTMGMCHHLPVSWNIAQP